MNSFLLVLSILLWLGAINLQTSYTKAQIHAIEMQHQPQLQQVYNDEELEAEIWGEYNDDARLVEITDWNQNQ